MKKHYLKLAVLFVTVAVMLSILASCEFGKDKTTSSTVPEAKMYTVTLELADGTLPEGLDSSIVVEENETVTLPTPEKEGHVFLGWFTEEDAQFSEETPITSDITLTAKWEITKVTVKFLNYLDKLISEQLIDWGTAAVAPEIEQEAAGMPFKEWDTDITCIKSDVTVRPIYARRTYTVTFSVDADATPVESQTIYHGELPERPEDPDMMGYSLVGWYLDPEFMVECNFDTAFDADTTIYAKFTNDYHVIRTAADLIAISENPTWKYVLLNDIDLGGNEWIPIENFSGALDGNGHTIYNFSMASTAANLAFINNNSGLIKNLKFSSFRLEYEHSANRNSYGAVIVANNSGTIRNCEIVDGNIVMNLTLQSANASSHLAVIAAVNSGEIINCVNNANLTLNIVNGCYGGGKWDGNSSTLNAYIGIIAGLNKGTVKESETYGKLVIKSESGMGSTSYDYCHANFYIGGISGRNDANAKIYESVSLVEISAALSGSINSRTIYIGSLAGYNASKIYDCYASGKISVENTDTVLGGAIGGVVGVNATEQNVSNVYADTNVTVGDNISACVAGYVAKNEAGATLTKGIFAGNVTIGANVTEYGYICASKSGDILHCYYDTSSVLTVAGEIVAEGTCTAGIATEKDTLLTDSFIFNTLQWDRDVWSIVDGSIPTLNEFDK